MKVKNIMFSGFAAAILMGVGAANAVVANPVTLADQAYVDGKINLVAGQKENAANKFTDATKEAWKSATNKDVQFPTINVAEQIALDSVAQISADVADLTDIRAAANKATEDIAKLNGGVETPGSVANTIAAALTEKNYTTMADVEEKGYLTAVPAEYVTSEELAAENYTTMADVEGKGYAVATTVNDELAKKLDKTAIDNAAGTYMVTSDGAGNITYTKVRVATGVDGEGNATVTE